MAARTELASPAAPDCGPARLEVAIELSKKSWLVAVQSPFSGKASLHSVASGDAAALLDVLE
ncbi:hypothetical protein ACFOGJ_03025, partial [Marinibaculum pumilum]